MIEPCIIEHLLLLSVACTDTDWIICGVQGALIVLVNGLCQRLCYISLLLELLGDECEGLLCIYVMTDSWSVSC